MRLKRLWEFSSQLQTEIFLGSRIRATGKRKDLVLDKYKDDLSKLKSNSRFNSLIISSILIFPAILAVGTVQESIEILGTTSIQKIFFTNSLSIASYYAFNTVFILLFGMMTVASLLQGDVFKFLHTLPLSKAELQILGAFTFIRLLFYQLIIMISVFPLGLLYITQSLTVFLASFVLNLVNLLLISYLLIIVIEKMRSYLFQQEQGFSWKSVLRYGFFVFYIISAFSIYYFLGAISSFLSQLYELNLIPEQYLIWINHVLAIVAFPFSTGYLLSLVSLQIIPDQITLISMLIGGVLLLVLTWRVVRKGNEILLNIAFKNTFSQETDRETDHEIVIAKRQPILAYIRMNLLTVARDLSSMISITMAVLFPLLPLLQNRGTDPITSFLFYSGFVLFFSNNALSVSEGSLGGLLSSLPFSHRSMLRGKQVLLGAIYLISYGLLTGASLGRFFDLNQFLLILMLSIILPNTFLITKSYFFGRINNEFTLYDIEDESSFLRNMILIIPVIVMVGLEFGLIEILPAFFPILENVLVFVGINIVIILLLELINRLMFD